MDGWDKTAHARQRAPALAAGVASRFRFLHWAPTGKSRVSVFRPALLDMRDAHQKGGERLVPFPKFIISRPQKGAIPAERKLAERRPNLPPKPSKPAKNST